jgi:hypothetical protein
VRSRGALALAVSVVATAVAVVSGVLGWRWPTLVAVLVAAAAEPLVPRGGGALESILARASLDRLPRTMLRMFAVLAVGYGAWQHAGLPAAYGWTAALFIAADTGLVLLVVYVDHARTPVVLLRNVDLPAPRISPAPPRRLTNRTVVTLGVLELAVLLPSLVAPTAAWPQWVFGGAAVALLLVLDGWLAAAARAAGGRLRGRQFLRTVQGWLDRYQPEVLVYFGGKRESAYQLTMWLTTLERLPQRTIVLLRDPKVLATLPPTSLPVLCVPGSVDLMSLDLGSAHVALFAANVGNSLHVLRLPHLMTVFIGHGDSDKSASSSPFAKVYDEIWVAGPAARDRYRRAEVGVREEDNVEVGRPQLDDVQDLGRRDGDIPTLLYAPTWEGWNAEQHYTSLDSLGPEIISSALAYPGQVRVIYKPHPFTGRRDPRIARSDARIVAMLEAANAAAGLPTARARLSAVADAVVVDDGLDGAFSHCDRSASETAADRSKAEVDFWAERPAAAHVVVGADGPSLYSCFQQTDGMVSDISSVITDFTATGRPYAVTNPTAVERTQFVQMFPAVGAGTVLGPGEGVHGFLEVLTGAAPDLLADRRAQLRTELLGSAELTATERFVAAVDSLVARGRAREAAHVSRGILEAGDFSAGGGGVGEPSDDD